jgi:hypothetical protein
MAELKRLEVKYIRDGAKAAYTKDTECYICGALEDLQLHHYYTVTLLWEKWKRTNKIVIQDAEHIMRIRDDFVSEYYTEMYDETVTLCKFHHMDRLHKVYGKVPSLITAKKQKKWCDARRAKEYNI